MEDILELGIENLERYAHAVAGFGIAAGITYASKLNHHRNGREMFPDPEDDWHERLLEEDPVQGSEAYRENPAMEAYYGNIDTLKSNARLGGRAVVATGIADVFETIQFDQDYIGLEDYPEMAAGMYAGIKAAEYAPTPFEPDEE